jgi:hypothetical protein
MTRENHRLIRLLLEEHFRSTANSLWDIETDEVHSIEDGVRQMLSHEESLHDLGEQIAGVINKWRMQYEDLFCFESINSYSVDSEENIFEQ